MNISGKHILVVVSLTVSGLWGYGYTLASTDLKDGLSLLEAGFTHKSLNPLSAMGYKYNLNSSESWQNHVNNYRCEKEQREIYNKLYTYEDFGSSVYKHRKEALAKGIKDECSKYK